MKNGSFDNILIGTSRIGVMKTEVIKKYLRGNTFNLSSPSFLSEEHYYLLKYAIQNNNIKNVIYGLDFMSLNGMKIKSTSEFNEIKNDIMDNKNIKDAKIHINHMFDEIDNS